MYKCVLLCKVPVRVGNVRARLYVHMVKVSPRITSALPNSALLGINSITMHEGECHEMEHGEKYTELVQ